MKLMAVAAMALLASCTGTQPGAEIKLLDANNFNTTVDGKSVTLLTLRSTSGMTLQTTNYGLRVVSLWTPDRDGKFDDVALGYENIERYLNLEGERFLGCVVGRYANRIANGEFKLDGNTYTLPQNNNGQTLHGGLIGIDQAVWDIAERTDSTATFKLTSPDGSDGFPGNLAMTVFYGVTSKNEFIIRYTATTDKPTVVNLSNHAFFNLKGRAGGTITDHVLTISADATTPVTEVLIPTGEIASVDGTPFDFRKATPIGQRIDADHEQLKNGKGYDHNWVLTQNVSAATRPAVTLYEPNSGRIMEVLTDQPGVQFYSGNFFDGMAADKYGKAIGFREALALETQKFPDSPNHEHFPSTRLNPGETYKQVCIYKFSTDKK